MRDPLEEHFGMVLTLGLINVDEDAEERFGEKTFNSFLFAFSPVHAFRVTSGNPLEGLVDPYECDSSLLCRKVSTDNDLSKFNGPASMLSLFRLELTDCDLKGCLTSSLI